MTRIHIVGSTNDRAPGGSWSALGALDDLVQDTPSGFGVVLEADFGRPGDAVVVVWEPSEAARIEVLCHHVRGLGLFVVAVTDGSSANDVLALMNGADAVVSTPLRPSAVEAAKVAYERVVSGRVSEVTVDDTVEWGALAVSVRAHRVTVDGHSVALPLRHVRLLAMLAAAPGMPVSREEMLREVWGLDFDPETNVIDVTVHRLRRTLRRAGMRGVIQSVRGVGYKLGDLEG